MIEKKNGAWTYSRFGSTSTFSSYFIALNIVDVNVPMMKIKLTLFFLFVPIKMFFISVFSHWKCF